MEAAGGGGGRRRRRRRVEGRRRRRRRGDAGAQAAAAQSQDGGRGEGASPGGGSLTALVGDHRSPKARVGSSADLAKNGQVPRRFEPFFRPLVPVGGTNRYQRCIGTGWWHQPVPKVHQKLRANRCTFGTGFSHQPVPKGFSLFFVSCFIKTTITFERKVQMT